jgi:urease accessory protein
LLGIRRAAYHAVEDGVQGRGEAMARVLRIAAMAMAAGAGSFASPASAHHLMGGALPNTAWQGLLSGLGHPIIGIDHFAFVVGVGLMSHLAGRITLLPLLFVAGTVLGCFAHVQGYTIPWVEPALALTVAAAAAVVGTRAKAPTGLLAPLFALAGGLHGYAYGESIVGAEPAPLVAYIAGFGAIQFGLAVASGAALRAMVARDYVSETRAARAAGAGLAVLAALAFVNAAMAG